MCMHMYTYRCIFCPGSRSFWTGFAIFPGAWRFWTGCLHRNRVMYRTWGIFFALLGCAVVLRACVLSFSSSNRTAVRPPMETPHLAQHPLNNHQQRGGRGCNVRQSGSKGDPKEERKKANFCSRACLFVLHFFLFFLC